MTPATDLPARRRTARIGLSPRLLRAVPPEPRLRGGTRPVATGAVRAD